MQIYNNAKTLTISDINLDSNIVFIKSDEADLFPTDAFKATVEEYNLNGQVIKRAILDINRREGNMLYIDNLSSEYCVQSDVGTKTRTKNILTFNEGATISQYLTEKQWEAIQTEIDKKLNSEDFQDEFDEKMDAYVENDTNFNGPNKPVKLGPTGKIPESTLAGLNVDALNVEAEIIGEVSEGDVLVTGITEILNIGLPAMTTGTSTQTISSTNMGVVSIINPDTYALGYIDIVTTTDISGTADLSLTICSQNNTDTANEIATSTHYELVTDTEQYTTQYTSIYSIRFINRFYFDFEPIEMPATWYFYSKQMSIACIPIVSYTANDFLGNDFLDNTIATGTKNWKFKAIAISYGTKFKKMKGIKKNGVFFDSNQYQKKYLYKDGKIVDAPHFFLAGVKAGQSIYWDGINLKGSWGINQQYINIGEATSDGMFRFFEPQEFNDFKNIKYIGLMSQQTSSGTRETIEILNKNKQIRVEIWFGGYSVINCFNINLNDFRKNMPKSLTYNGRMWYYNSDGTINTSNVGYMIEIKLIDNNNEKITLDCRVRKTSSSGVADTYFITNVKFIF